MKYFILAIGLACFAFSGCDIRQREEALQKREATLNQREQELLLKEKSLQLKDEELVKRQQQMDSTIVADTTAKYNAKLAGVWNVQMTCTETSCTGSAVGDTKTETWEISYQDRNVIARAKVNNELVRVYSGLYNGTTLELAEALESEQKPATKMIVRLQLTSDTQLEGQREIDRISENCRIIYSMKMKKNN
ncbi:MAG TPA: hypothetical protein VMR70_06615 [Flavisolibacter sp.]|nr:hypothetical protein [Flavisolibacter sp.]